MNKTEQRVLDAVSQAYGVSVEDMLGTSRKREYVDARHMAMWLLHRVARQTSVAIGRLFNRSYSTVLHAIDFMRHYTEHDTVAKNHFNALKERLKRFPEIDRANIIDKVTGIEINGRLYKVMPAAEPGKYADCDDCHLKGICNAHDNIPRENERADKLAQTLPNLCAFNNEHNEVFLME